MILKTKNLIVFSLIFFTSILFSQEKKSCFMKGMFRKYPQEICDLSDFLNKTDNALSPDKDKKRIYVFTGNAHADKEAVIEKILSKKDILLKEYLDVDLVAGDYFFR